MRKNLLSTLVAGTLAVAGSANAGLIFDLNGTGAGGVIHADSFDWAPTSFLAMGGNAAVLAAVADLADNGIMDSVHSFDVLTHARMTAYKDANTGLDQGISRTDEITLVSRFTEVVTSVSVIPAAGVAIATFATTGAGWLDMYYSSVKDGVDLTGSGFDNGTLIMHAEGVGAATGIFTVSTNIAPSILDGFNTNNYGAQLTVTGTGSQTNLTAGTTSMALDSNFFKTDLTGFAIAFANISQGLPYISADPSDCYNPTAAANAVGTDDGVTQCTNTHVAGAMSVQGADGGYAPNIGPVNGFLGGSTSTAPDFVAQTDFNSPVEGVPEPHTLALLGLGLAGLGFSARRRRG